MTYKTVQEFFEEWPSFPDRMNFLVSYSYQSVGPVTGTWTLTICQPRKEQFQDVTIGPIYSQHSSWIEGLAEKSLNVMAKGFERDKQYAHDEFTEHRK